MADTVISLLMTYFPDDRPVCLSVLKKHYSDETISKAIAGGLIDEYDKDCYGEPRYVITASGKELRNK